MRRRVLALISAVRDSRPDSVEAYTRGGCFRFFLILRAVWPEAEAWYDGDHVVTRIGGRYYDIRGDVTRKVKDAYPLVQERRLFCGAWRWGL